MWWGNGWTRQGCTGDQRPRKPLWRCGRRSSRRTRPICVPTVGPPPLCHHLDSHPPRGVRPAAGDERRSVRARLGVTLGLVIVIAGLLAATTPVFATRASLTAVA